MEPVPRAFVDASQWLDGAFNGVNILDGMVVVHLAPQPPLAVSVFEGGTAGTMFDIRCSLGRDIPMSTDLMTLIMNISADNAIPEGHLILRRERSAAQVGVELRYCISPDLLTNQHDMVQMGVRMSSSVESLAEYLRDTFGGNLSAGRPATVAFTGFSAE
jgi:hypothetical protein